jgi:hypothetical protein
MISNYTEHTRDFQQHMKRLVRDRFPSAFGGACEVGHHLLRRLNHPQQVNDPRFIVPLTASQHDEFHANPPTISVKELLYEDGTCAGCVFLYHGKEYRWSNRLFVKAWNTPAQPATHATP